MNIVTAIETMRTIVDAYDKFEAKKLRIKRKTEKLLKGGKKMKFGTVIGIVVGALALIAAGAAAAYFLAKKKGCCCCCEDDCCCDEDCCCDCCDETVDECCCEEPVVIEEAPAEKKISNSDIEKQKIIKSADVRFAMRYMGPVRQKTVNHVRRGTEQH